MTGTRIGWRLTLIPVGDDLAWSLIRRGDTTPEGPAGAGIAERTGDLRALADSLLPRGETLAELWSGPLADPAAELRCAVRLGHTLLPEPLRAELLAAPVNGTTHTVTVACQGWPARVPWDALALDDRGDVRLVERCRLTAGFSPAIVAGRRRTPVHRPGAPGLRVIDPGRRDAGPALAPIYPGGYPLEWEDVLGEGEDLVPDGGLFGAADLGRLLRAGHGWARMLYLGHVVNGSAETPAAAAMVLSSALGQERFTAHAWLRDPESWPAPPRIALIACGSDDSQHVEQSGLPVAALNAGAELLTVTRWTLPLDADPPREAGTTSLALAVDAAHRTRDPVRALAHWQCDQLARWRSHGERRHAPLLWGSLATYVEPAGPGRRPGRRP